MACLRESISHHNGPPASVGYCENLERILAVCKELDVPLVMNKLEVSW